MTTNRRRIGRMVLGTLLVCGTASAAPKLEFQLADVQGRLVRAEDYRGRPIFLEFGACW